VAQSLEELLAGSCSHGSPRRAASCSEPSRGIWALGSCSSTAPPILRSCRPFVRLAAAPSFRWTPDLSGGPVVGDRVGLALHAQARSTIGAYRPRGGTTMARPRPAGLRLLLTTDGSRQAHVALSVAAAGPWPANATAHLLVARGGIPLGPW